jgi:hypothetical protein
MDGLNPRLLSNNLLLPYLVSVLEGYFKSTFIALLRYSERKETFLKGARLSADHLAKISTNEMSIEEAIAETLPFQRISSICQHFKALDPKLDLNGVLLKPFRRRKKKLFEEIDALVFRRHDFVHKGIVDIDFSDADVKKALNDLEASVIRCYRRITDHYGWVFDEPPQKRHAYLQEVCAGDQGLLAEVERLLANDCLAGDFMEESAAGEAVQAIIQEHSRAVEGRHIGPYRLHRKQMHCRRCMRRETNCPSSRWAI